MSDIIVMEKTMKGSSWGYIANADPIEESRNKRCMNYLIRLAQGGMDEKTEDSINSDDSANLEEMRKLLDNYSKSAERGIVHGVVRIEEEDMTGVDEIFF